MQVVEKDRWLTMGTNPVCKIRFYRKGLTLSLMISLVLAGCAAPEPPLSAEAKAFKAELKECIIKLAGPLVEPVASKNIGAIKRTLASLEPETVKLCRMCPFQVGVLDREGEGLAIFPERPGVSRNFASYRLVEKVVKDRKIFQQRFFLQDGSEIYIIGVPLIQGNKLVGLLAVSLSAEEAMSRWGISEKEFLELNFNI